MNDFAVLFQIVAGVTAAVAPMVIVVRLIAGSDSSPFGGMLQSPRSASWPVGIQEEEPKAWKFGPAAA